MERDQPPSMLMNIFRVAALLKVLGVVVLLVAAWFLLRESFFYRWAFAFGTGVFLFIWLLPWTRFPFAPKISAGKQFTIGLIIAIVTPYWDLIYGSWVPYHWLLENEYYELELGWSWEQITHVHSLGVLFVFVPIALASWQYGHKGREYSCYLVGIWYISLPWLMPENILTWRIYWSEGFVLLGVMQIIAFSIAILTNIHLEEKAKLKNANKELTKLSLRIERLVASQERNRLARELHDTISHSLSGATIQLQAIRTLIAQNELVKADIQLHVAFNQIRHSLRQSRRIISGLRAAPLETYGLWEAMERRMEHFSEKTKITVKIKIEKFDKRLTDNLEQSVYRIVDESLNNVEKYANANQVELIFYAANNRCHLLIQDDGVGFQTEQITEQQFGLLGMNEWAQLVDAHFEVQSVPGIGTTVSLCFPILYEEDEEDVTFTNM